MSTCRHQHTSTGRVGLLPGTVPSKQKVRTRWCFIKRDCDCVATLVFAVHMTDKYTTCPVMPGILVPQHENTLWAYKPVFLETSSHAQKVVAWWNILLSSISMRHSTQWSSAKTYNESLRSPILNGRLTGPITKCWRWDTAVENQ